MLLTSAAKNRLGPLSHLLNMPPPLKSDEPLDIAFAFPSPVQGVIVGPQAAVDLTWALNIEI